MSLIYNISEQITRFIRVTHVTGQSDKKINPRHTKGWQVVSASKSASTTRASRPGDKIMSCRTGIECVPLRFYTGVDARDKVGPLNATNPSWMFLFFYNKINISRRVYNITSDG